MFVLSVKAEKRRLIPLVLCVTLIAAMLIASLCFPASRTMVNEASVRVDGDEAIASYLKSLGYTVALDSAAVEEIRLPDEFDEALDNYNALQRQGGFDLSGYAGQRVKLRTYALLDHESGLPAQIHVYTHGDRVIGGDVAAEYGSFLLPLIPASTACDETDKDVTTDGTTG